MESPKYLNSFPTVSIHPNHPNLTGPKKLPSPNNSPLPSRTTWSKPSETELSVEKLAKDDLAKDFCVEKLAREHLAGLVLLFGCREEKGKLVGAGIDSGETSGRELGHWVLTGSGPLRGATLMEIRSNIEQGGKI